MAIRIDDAIAFGFVCPVQHVGASD